VYVGLNQSNGKQIAIKQVHVFKKKGKKKPKKEALKEIYSVFEEIKILE